MPDAPTAFFSYSRDDLEFALRLAKDLKKAGANVWMDKLDIRPGQLWERKVEDALNRSGRMLVILSPSAINSPNVMAEVAFALDEQKEVIPVLYLECRIPFRLRPFQYVDFRGDYSQGLEELLNTVGAEQQGTASDGIAAWSARLMGQTDVSDADQQQRAAEQARLGEERKRALDEESRRAAELDRLENDRKQAAEQERIEELRKQREQTEAARLAAVAEAERQAARREQATGAGRGGEAGGRGGSGAPAGCRTSTTGASRTRTPAGRRKDSSGAGRARAPPNDAARTAHIALATVGRSGSSGQYRGNNAADSLGL